MKKNLANSIRHPEIVALSWLTWQLCQSPAHANPTGGVVAQGSASFNTSGSQLTVTTSPNAFINWSSFNINAGETTTFVEPSATSVVWNHITDPNASQILGTLNANGYVILQNQSGFYVGGSASINTAGLLMTTDKNAAPTLAGGDAWTFNSLPPTAKIINFGQINISGGGSAFLLADDIENNGTISAPGGKIGLYAGEQVLVSMSPDGRGLSAQVTLPQGSVDNEGNLVADGGTIAAQAQTVNQNGLIQANSVQNINGVIELVASDSLTLGTKSDIEANGDPSAANTSASPGGFVVLQAANTFSDTPSSTINVAGTLGGVTGIVEIFGNNLTDATSVQSQINGVSAAQFGSQDILLVNPYDIALSSSTTDTSSTSPNINVADLASYSHIDLRALDNIELSAQWSLNDPGAPACVSLQAGNSIILDDGAGISAGNNWGVNLVAGTGFVPSSLQPTPSSGSDGIYLNGSAYVQTLNGDINVWVANEVQIATSGSDLIGNTGISTLNGGNITVNAQYGDVNTGGNPVGYVYNEDAAPYYTVSTGVGGSNLGGISTAAGGNVTINAGGDVYSYLPAGNSGVSQSANDGGSGAFGPEPGNVTITAGGSVYGHYVLADGVGSITAGQNIGAASGHPFALSLMDGSWSVNAPNGSIYLQEVRNPNGVFDNLGNKQNPGFHLFDYDPQASVDLTANTVYLTGENVPRPDGNVPVLYPPILDISTGSGGLILEANVTLFPSAYQSIDITTSGGGNFVAEPNGPVSSPVQLFMSDSSAIQWLNANTFSINDHAAVPPDLNDLNPATLYISGSMENLNLITSKATSLTVAGDMLNCGFSGENLNAGDVTTISVGGQIFNQSAYTSVTLPQAISGLSAADLPIGIASAWDNIFALALNPAVIATLQAPANLLPAQWADYVAQNASLFPVTFKAGQVVGSDQNFIYSPATSQLGFGGPMAQSVLTDLSQPLTVLRFGANGLPATYTGADGKTYFATDQVNWVAPSVIATLFSASQADPSPTVAQLGYRLGGPGQFDVNADSISLGNSSGILSCGVFDPSGGFNRYADLAAETPAGATLNVTVTGDLDMLTSTIATLGGGDVNLISTGGSMDLGAETEGLKNSFQQVGFGVFTAGPGNVNVKALEDVNIDGSRIAAYDGGNIFVESQQGGVDVGSGGDTFSGVAVSYVNPKTGLAGSYLEDVYGNGIVANTLVDPAQVPGGATLPGNITVETPNGNITAGLGGITQQALNGSIAGGPTINLTAGTTGVPATPTEGNIDLGQSGVIGGTVNVSASGDITGLIISRQSSTITAVQHVDVTVLSGGSADVSGASVSGVIVGVGGASVSGGSVTAEVLSQNASVNGGSSQSTLGATASATSASQSAANQSDSQAKQQLASNGDESDDDRKKKRQQPLIQHVKRVTVILPKT